jgi:hypothetical protein
VGQATVDVEKTPCLMHCPNPGASFPPAGASPSPHHPTLRDDSSGVKSWRLYQGSGLEASDIRSGGNADGPAYTTCRNGAAVCTEFEIGRRRPNLAFHRHAEVAGIIDTPGRPQGRPSLIGS